MTRTPRPARRSKAVKAPRPRRPKIVDQATAYAQDVAAGRILAGPYVRKACERHLRDLERQQELGIRWDLDEAARAIGFFREVLVLADGRAFVLEPFQAFIVGSVFGWRMEDGSRRFKTAYVESGKGSGKALALDTPIPTPNGWTTMGALHVGDVVFDDRGLPTEVIEAHPVMEGHPCYAVRFDDGAEIVADAEHLWMTEKRSEGTAEDPGRALRGVPLAQRGAWRWRVRTTEEISRTLRYPNGQYDSANHSVPLAGPLETPEAELPIPPYVLGLWLGDGDTNSARLTVGVVDAATIRRLVEAEGEALKRQGDGGQGTRWAFSDGRRGGGAERAQTLSARLRALGVLGGKHVPPCYLRASCGQRLALLQGLCDTDASASGSTVEFVTISMTLARDVHELLASLGIKASMPKPNARYCNGKRARDAYRLTFCPPEGLRVFRLERKQARITGGTVRRRLSQDRRIVACEPVPSVPVRCIRVASSRSLFLAGRSMVPTHNTPLAAGIGLLALIADGEPAPEVYAAATMQDQASICFRDAKGMVERREDLAGAIEVLAASLVPRGDQGAVFRAVSSEHRGLDGKRVYCALIDELHEHPTSLVVDKMRAGLKARRNGFTFEITNSGDDLESVCWHHHEYSVKVLEGIEVNEAWFAYVCALDEGDDWRDEACWPKANPGLGTILPISYLREQVREAQGMPSKEGIVKRLNFCIWTQQHTVWIPMDKWRALPVLAEAPPGWTACALGLDLSSKLDLTAAVVVLRYPDERPPVEIEIAEGQGDPEAPKIVKRLSINFRVHVVPFFWRPLDTLARAVNDDRASYDLWKRDGWLRATPGNVVDYDAIRDAIVDEIGPKYGLKSGEIAFDPYNAEMLTRSLETAGYRRTQVDQTVRNISEPAKLLEALIVAGRLSHDGNPVMTWCMSNVAVREDKKGNIFPFKPSARKRIDGAVALITGLSRLVAAPEMVPTPRISVFGGLTEEQTTAGQFGEGEI